MLKTISNFFSYWYFRYTLVTELYMVEKWERIFVHVFYILMLTLLWYFNAKVLLNITEYATSPLFAALDLMPKSHASSMLQNDANFILSDL